MISFSKTKGILLLVFLLVLGSSLSQTVTADNASLQYVWNSSCTTNNAQCWIPWVATETGRPKVDINLLNITAENISTSDTLITNYISPYSGNEIIISGGINVSGQAYLSNLNVSGVQFSEGNISIANDLIVQGILYGGSPLKVAGGINLTDTGAITFPDGSIQSSAKENTSYNYVYNGTDFIGARATANGRLRLDIASMSAERSLTNFTGSDSILTDYIYPNSNPSIILKNITILDDIRVLGNSYLGSFQIQDDLIIGSNNFSSTYVGIGTTSPNGVLDVRGDIWSSSELNFDQTTNGNSAGYINYQGYAGGTTQFRDLYIDNGKAGTIAFFDGSSGNVGIGSTGPGYTLDINSAVGSVPEVIHIGTEAAATHGIYLTPYGSGHLFNTLTVGSGEELRIQTGGVTTPTDMMTFDTTGNVGIGTTSPTHTLNVDGTANFTGSVIIGDALTDALAVGVSIPTVNTLNHIFAGSAVMVSQYTASGEAEFGNNFYYNSGWKYRIADEASNMKMVNGEIQFQDATSGSADGAITWDTNVVIDTSGNVGIGTTSPLYRFHVDLQDDNNLQIRDSTTFAGGVDINAVNDANNANVPLVIWSNLTALQGGNVGIGTTSPSAVLEAQSRWVNSTGTIGVTVAGDVMTGSGTAFLSEYDVGSPIYIYDDANNLWREYEIESITSDTGLVITGLFGGPSQSGLPFRYEYDFFKLNDLAGNEVVTVKSPGNMGIGTTSPSMKLSVTTSIDQEGIRINNTVQSPVLMLESGIANAGARNWDLVTNNFAIGDFAIRRSTAQGGIPATGSFVINATGGIDFDTSGIPGFSAGCTMKLDANGGVYC